LPKGKPHDDAPPEPPKDKPPAESPKGTPTAKPTPQKSKEPGEKSKTKSKPSTRSVVTKHVTEITKPYPVVKTITKLCPAEHHPQACYNFYSIIHNNPGVPNKFTCTDTQKSDARNVAST